MNFLDGKKTYISGATVIIGMAMFVYAKLTFDAQLLNLSITVIGIGFGGAVIGIGHKGQKFLSAVLELAAKLKEMNDSLPPEEKTSNR